MTLAPTLTSFLQSQLKKRASLLIHGGKTEERLDVINEIIPLLRDPRELDEAYVFIDSSGHLKLPIHPLWLLREVEDHYGAVLKASLRLDASLVAAIELPDDCWSLAWTGIETGHQVVATLLSPQPVTDSIANALVSYFPLSVMKPTLEKHPVLVFELTSRSRLSALTLEGEHLKLETILKLD